MKKTTIIFTLSLPGLFLGGGCLAPRFEPVAEVPPGHGLVYIYSLGDGTGAVNNLTRNNADFAALGPDQYLAQFANPGTNMYGFHMNWVSRGGLLGHMFLNHQNDPEPTALTVVAGKTYYFKVIGIGLNASFWRMDETTALQELQNCRRVKIKEAGE